MWDQTSRIQRTLTALAGKPVRVLVTTSGSDTTRLSIPENACVVPFIPHAEVLPQASVLVTHAGHGTVTAALEHGVPLVCLPNTTSDQPGVAAQVAALGAGIALEGDSAPPEVIGDAVTSILSDRTFAEAARRLGAAIAAAHAPETAVAWLEERVEVPKPAARN